jgi:hypothetical protein
MGQDRTHLPEALLVDSRRLLPCRASPGSTGRGLELEFVVVLLVVEIRFDIGLDPACWPIAYPSQAIIRVSCRAIRTVVYFFFAIGALPAESVRVAFTRYALLISSLGGSAGPILGLFSVHGTTVP